MNWLLVLRISVIVVGMLGGFGLQFRIYTVGHESVAKRTQELIYIFTVPDVSDALVMKQVTAAV